MRGEWSRKPKNGASVVFVHGILSSGETCWRHENGAYWPELLKSEPALERLGIYVYSYETGIFSGTYSLNDVVDDLKERFFTLDKVADSRRIVFVCHSMGGIVVRKFLVERVSDLLDRKIEIGLFLVASPSLGANYANWLAPIAKVMGHSQADALRFTQGNIWLNGLDKEFQNLKESARLKLHGKELIEDKFVVLRRLWRKQVVEPFAGARYFGDPYKVPGSDHFSIAKPKDSSADQHRLLLAFIEKTGGMAGAAPNVPVNNIVTRESPNLVSSKTRIRTAQTPLREEVTLTKRPSTMKRVFISYRHVKPDEDLALTLEKALADDGCQVFVDRRMLVGTEWAAEIDRQLRAAEFFVVLLSAESIRSDMVRQEIKLAHELKQQKGLRILPVRVDFTGALPYDLGGYLNPLHYALWDTKTPLDDLASDIRLGIRNSTELPNSGRSAEHGDSPAELLELHEATEKRGAPLPQIDPRVLEIAMERGAMRGDSPFYVRRPADDEMGLQLKRRGSTTIVKGARQMGKSSLLVRAAAQASSLECKVCYIDFQRMDEVRLADLDGLLLYLMSRLARDLNTPRKPKEFWDENLGPKDSATEFIEYAVLADTEKLVVLLLDEADRVFKCGYRNDFFALLRFWTNRRATSPHWERFNLVVAHATDPVLWIDDINQSPFNVGHPVVLGDFDTSQFRDLSRRYGVALSDAESGRLQHLIGGHPYLTRQSLFLLATAKITLEELERAATRLDGPFSDHLRRLTGILAQREPLRRATLQILQGKSCEDEHSFQRLFTAGLVVGESRQEARMRCGLYEHFFRTHL